MNNIENIYTGYDDIVAEFTEAGIKDTITTLLKEIEKFRELVKPLVEYLRKNYNPHCKQLNNT